MNLIPAYGRDYKSKAAILADLKADKDFIISNYGSVYDGKPVNLAQIKGVAGAYPLQVRYGNLRKVVVFSQRELEN